MTTDKLAITTLDNYSRLWFNETDDLDDLSTGYVAYPDALQAMQAYHEQKMKEVTDSDIEAWASLQVNPESKKDFERGLWLGLKVGAKAALNNEIKHIEK